MKSKRISQKKLLTKTKTQLSGSDREISGPPENMLVTKFRRRYGGDDELIINGRFVADFEADIPRRRCVASNKDGDWLVFVDTEDFITDSYPISTKCFLWNHHLQVMVRLPCLPKLHLTHFDPPAVFYKCLVTCHTTRSCLCRYRVCFFLDNYYYWCSHKCNEWNEERYVEDAKERYSDVVLFKSSLDRDWHTDTDKLCIDRLCGITEYRAVFCYNDNLEVQSPDNRSYRHEKRLIVHYGKERDRLFLVERKPQSAWEVWEIDFSGPIASFISVSNLEGIVVLLSDDFSAAYSHTPKCGLEANCIYYTEKRDYENFYMFSLADKTFSTLKNRRNSKFPIWFLETRYEQLREAGGTSRVDH